MSLWLPSDQDLSSILFAVQDIIFDFFPRNSRTFRSANGSTIASRILSLVTAFVETQIMENHLQISTHRLKLIPANVRISRAEIDNPQEFSRLIGAIVPENWPPDSVVDALPLLLSWLEAAPDQIGWFGWYALASIDNASSPTLIGGGGFLGPPNAGAAQIGYSVLPQFQSQGYATEMVNGLIHWALSHSDVSVIQAETEWANPSSVRVLEKCGFVALGPTDQPGGSRFEFQRT